MKKKATHAVKVGEITACVFGGHQERGMVPS